MMVITVATTTPQRTQGTPQLNSNHDNPIREGAPPTGAYWAKTYGGTSQEGVYSVQETADGGYIVAGSTNSFGAGGYDAWVLKLNSTGSVTWQKTYGGTSQEGVYSVQETADGGYILAGYTDSFGVGDDVWVLKLNSSGGVTWQKTYGGSGDEEALFVEQTLDGGCVVAGYTSSFGVGGFDAWVLKLDSAGSVTWQKTYGGTGEDYAYSVQQTFDGGYIVAATTTSFGAGYYDAWVLKLNSTGSVTWQNTYGGSNLDFADSIEQTADGGYVVTGYTSSFSVGGYDFWVLRLDSTGGVTWQKAYGGGGYDYALSVKQTADGGYIVAGRTTSFGTGGYDFWVLKLNSTGSVTWQKTYGGSNDDEARSVEQTADGGYIVTGYTSSFGVGGYDVWVVKLGVSGDIVWDAGSGASTTTTSVTPANSSATTSWTSATPTISTATITETTATPQNTSANVKEQSDTTAPATIHDLATSNPTATSITLTWTAPGDAGMSGNATGYWVKYSTSGSISAANWGSATNYTQAWKPAKNGTTETRTVSGLSNATRYWFAVEAYDEVPYFGGVSNSPSGMTADAFPPAAIIDLATGNPTATSVTLTWTAPGDNETLGTAAGYIVKYSTSSQITASNWASATTYTQTWMPLSAGSTEIHIVSGLSNASRYWFAVEAYDTVPNYGGVSNSPSGVTSDAFLPARITDLATSNPTETSITLSWTAPGDNGTLGTATGYVVKYSTSGPVNASNWTSAAVYTQTWTPLPAGSTETRVASGLKYATRYWFAVESYDEVPNYGGVSNSPKETTLIPPGPAIDQPSNITYAFSATGNAITWHPTSQIPDHYTISVNGSTPISHNWNGTAITCSVDGFSAGTYNVACIAYDAMSRVAFSTVTVTVTGTAQPSSTDQGIAVIAVAGAVGWVAVVVLAVAMVVMRKRKK